MTAETTNYTISDKGSLGSISLIAGIALLVASIAGYFMDSAQFFHSYIVGYLFWLSIALGGLFFTIATHLFGAEWSIVLRRLSEGVMYTIPILAVLFIPILFGMHDLFHWTHEEVVAEDAILTAKSGYLNFTFFVIRAVIYFVIWFVLSRVMYKLSLKQDTQPSDALILKINKISAPAVILFALSTTFASFDWIMSLEPHWFSTIFGVYYFGGSFLAILCFLILLAMYLRKLGYLQNEITVEHYHDLGKLIYAFLVFWGYIGFSQYFLIWYANIPEETVWYTTRWENGWYIITLILVIGHFTIPFLALTFRATKRNFPSLIIIAVWVLIMHIFDLFWLSAPTFSHGHGPHLSWMDFTILLGIGGLFIWNVWKNITSNPLLVVGDRRLQKSIMHKV